FSDLSLLQDSQEDTDGCELSSLSLCVCVCVCVRLLDFVSQDEMLTPLGRLDKYISSENIFNRQMVARSLLDTLRAVSEDERDCVSVLEQIDRLADDSEPTVRAELMEQIPHIAIFCQENRPSIPFAFSKYLLPIVVRYLSDQNNLVGVRSVCSFQLIEILKQFNSNVIKVEQTTFLGPFEIFFPISVLFCFCIFSVLCSQVRQAAFQSLGPFISTFASPSSNAGQFFRDEERSGAQTHSTDAEAVCAQQEPAGHEEQDEDRAAQTAESLTADDSQKCLPSSSEEIPEQELFNSFHFWRTPIPRIDPELELLEEDRRPSAPALDRKHLQELIENLEPHIDDPDVKAQVDVLTAALRATALDSGLEDAFLEPRAARSNPFNSVPSCTALTDSVPSCTALTDSVPSCTALTTLSHDAVLQDVVPQALLEQYLSMTDPSRAQTVDMEIARHCAFSLPGVALTLGRQNWHCLRDTYETLASDMQWKVRRTLAFSIHELALILGDQLTAAHLVPIFNSFLKDLDEVRIGVLKHLYDFLKLLHQDTRRKYLYQLQEFLVTDNSRNWRFRSELAEQLVLLLELYSAQDVHDYLRPLALCLCTDRVSSVRWTSYRLVSEIIRKLSSCSSLLVSFLGELVEKFCHSQKWSGRQAFAFVCQLSIEEECLSLDQFSEHLLPPLLQLASDPVPNVRVLLAKTLRQTLLEREYFLSSVNCQQVALEHTLVALQTDVDKDVKYFASVHPGSTRLNEDAMSTTSSTY
uniref:Protein phosphatase 4 regulatory subunit 1 n=1 Tax=Cyprinus carpio TaxID=7962 RepID=A0A8C2EEN1_CYPCA